MRMCWCNAGTSGSGRWARTRNGRRSRGRSRKSPDRWVVGARTEGVRALTRTRFLHSLPAFRWGTHPPETERRFGEAIGQVERTSPEGSQIREGLGWQGQKAGGEGSHEGKADTEASGQGACEGAA